MFKKVLPQDEILNGFQSLPLHSLVFEKTASNIYIPKDIIKFASEVRPRDDGRYVHLIAMGAGEHWGQNRRGDRFQEWMLLGDKPSEKIAAIVEKNELPIPKEYGISTFPKLAYVYQNHANKDPEKAIGERVKVAAYNEKMRRAELVIFVKEASDPGLIMQIDEGYPVQWSMGCRVKYDICNICGHPAKTTADYCKHASAMNEIGSNGEVNCVDNPFPIFFDISRVPVPADRSAQTLKKLAGDNTSFRQSNVDFGMLLDLQEKIAKNQHTKRAMIRKTVELDKPEDSPINKMEDNRAKKIVALDSEDKEGIPASFLKKMKSIFGIIKLIKGLTSSGVVLNPEEIKHVSGDEPFPEEDMGDSCGAPGKGMLRLLKPMMESRCMYKDPAAKRISIRIISLKNNKDGSGDLSKKARYEKIKISSLDKNIQGYYYWLRKVASNHRAVMETANDPNVLDIVAPDRAVIKEAAAMHNIILGTTNNFDRSFIMPFIFEVNKYE